MAATLSASVPVSDAIARSAATAATGVRWSSLTHPAKRRAASMASPSVALPRSAPSADFTKERKMPYGEISPGLLSGPGVDYDVVDYGGLKILLIEFSVDLIMNQFHHEKKESGFEKLLCRFS